MSKFNTGSLPLRGILPVIIKKKLKTFGFRNEVLSEFAKHSMVSESPQITASDNTKLTEQSTPSDIPAPTARYYSTTELALELEDDKKADTVWAYLPHVGQSTTKECAIWLYGGSTM